MNVVIFSWAIITIDVEKFQYRLSLLDNLSAPIRIDDDDECESDRDEDGSPREMNSDVTVAYSMDECEENTAAGGSQDSAPLPVLLRELHFWYIDPDGREVSTKDQAAVTINGKLVTMDVVVNYHSFTPHFIDVVSVGFLIKCDKTSLENSYLTYSIDHTR